jgi:hypothetical protein
LVKGFVTTGGVGPFGIGVTTTGIGVFAIGTTTVRVALVTGLRYVVTMTGTDSRFTKGTVTDGVTAFTGATATGAVGVTIATGSVATIGVTTATGVGVGVDTTADLGSTTLTRKGEGLSKLVAAGAVDVGEVDPFPVPTAYVAPLLEAELATATGLTADVCEEDCCGAFDPPIGTSFWATSGGSSSTLGARG